MNASEVKKGDRVVFERGDTEFNGIALSDAKVAVHPGVKKAGIYLDVAYLDPSGSLVKVLSAKVLKDAVSDGDLRNIVELEHAARSLDHRRISLEAFGGNVTADDLRKEFQETKQDSGWKPFADSAEVEANGSKETMNQGNLLTEEVAALKEQLAAATVEVNDGKAAMDEVNKLTEERAGLESAVLGLQTQLESVTAERDGLKVDLAKSESEKAELQQRLTSAAEVALSETPLIEAGLAAGAKPDTSVYSSEGKQAQDTASPQPQIETTAQTEASAQASNDAQTE